MIVLQRISITFLPKEDMNKFSKLLHDVKSTTRPVREDCKVWSDKYVYFCRSRVTLICFKVRWCFMKDTRNTEAYIGMLQSLIVFDDAYQRYWSRHWYATKPNSDFWSVSVLPRHITAALKLTIAPWVSPKPRIKFPPMSLCPTKIRAVLLLTLSTVVTRAFHN